MTFSNPTIKNRNICYSLLVHIYESVENTSQILDSQKIERIEIFNKINQFCTTGSIVYSDDKQIIDKYFNRPLCFIQMFFKQQINVPNVNVPVENKEESYTHKFIITNFTILQRIESTIRYRIDFIDINFWKTRMNVNYTTYGQKDGSDEQEIGEILNTVFGNVKLKLNEDTIKYMDTKVRYIAKSNDTVESVFSFLTSRIFYESEMGNKIILMSYNMLEDKYFLYDMEEQDIEKCIDESKFPQSNMLVLSMYKRDSLEKMIQKQEVGIGTVSHKTRIQLLNDLQTRKIHKYDIKNNSFTSNQIDPVQMQNIFNLARVKDGGKIKTEDMKIQFEENSDPSEMLDGKKVFSECSYWNNDLNIYEEMVNSMINNDSLVVNINGNINRVPGADFQIYMTNPGQFSNESANDFEQMKEKYQQYTGLWIVSSVRHVIEPIKGQFNDVICLFRNW